MKILNILYHFSSYGNKFSIILLLIVFWNRTTF